MKDREPGKKKINEVEFSINGNTITLDSGANIRRPKINEEEFAWAEKIGAENAKNLPEKEGVSIIIRDGDEEIRVGK